MVNNIINGNIYNDVGGFTRFMVYKSISFLSTNHNRLFSTLYCFFRASQVEMYVLLIHIEEANIWSFVKVNIIEFICRISSSLGKETYK